MRIAAKLAASGLAFCVLFAAPGSGLFAAEAPGAVVAADGSGQYMTVQEGINASPQTASAEHPWTIRVKPGIYKERLQVQREKRWVHLVGDDAAATTITYNLNANILGEDGKPIGTFRTPTVWIDADDFTVENLTLENSAGNVGQALAIRIDGDRDVFRKCRFIGFQDTIMANRGRQYFEDCYIAGATDFIFGAATAWFERCTIFCVRGNYITAASTPQETPFGYVFDHCRIVGASDKVQTVLGRPWRAYAAVTFMNTEMDGSVRGVGWNNWGQPDREKTVRYAEFNSTGPGAKPAERVAWSKQLTAEEARAITIGKVLGGEDRWNPVANASK